VEISDRTIASAQYALGGLARRAEVRAHNVANANTPGFRAQRVDFESALAGALRSGDPRRAAAPAVVPGNDLPNANGNTVSVETELVGMLRDNLLRDAMVNAFNAKATLLRTALGA